MNNIAIKAASLSKRYRIGALKDRHDTLRDHLAYGVTSLFRRRHNSHQKQDTFWALKELSFDIKQGETAGIIGSNGAGKSTLLKILSRITKPTSGFAEIRGRVASLLEVGTGFHPELTGRENIYLNGAILGMKNAEIKRNFDAIVDFSGVEKFIDTPVKRYSSGMYVRLAFAVAAHLQPDILIVDEILSVGDMAFQRKCLGKMESVANEGRTVLFVSHNMGVIRSLCKQAYWLQEGQLLMVGSAVDVVDKYLMKMLHAPITSVDLRNGQRHPTYGQRLRMCELELNDGGPILHGEPLKVRIEYETYEAIEGVSLGFGFSNLDGGRIISFDTDVESDLLHGRRDVPKGLRGVAEFTVPRLLLQPSRYNLDVGAQCGGDVTLDYLPGCVQVEVLPGPNTPGRIIRNMPNVRMPASWTWNDGTATEETTTEIASPTNR
jgi:lipopolysaccharide transport system ATP-binding protein